MMDHRGISDEPKTAADIADTTLIPLAAPGAVTRIVCHPEEWGDEGSALLTVDPSLRRLRSSRAGASLRMTTVVSAPCQRFQRSPLISTTRCASRDGLSVRSTHS